MMKRVDRGAWAEHIARDYLEQRGLICLNHNFRCTSGEIDLIMQANDYLVFVEVRTRHCHAWASQSIHVRKQQRIRRAALCYLQHHPQMKQHASRFDVVTVTPPFDQPSVKWIAHAF